jgi:hypothetical protein
MTLKLSALGGGGEGGGALKKPSTFTHYGKSSGKEELECLLSVRTSCLSYFDAFCLATNNNMLLNKISFLLHVFPSHVSAASGWEGAGSCLGLPIPSTLSTTFLVECAFPLSIVHICIALRCQHSALVAIYCGIVALALLGPSSPRLPCAPLLPPPPHLQVQKNVPRSFAEFK